MDQTPAIMTRQQVLDLYFMDARFKLIELAAFLDRSYASIPKLREQSGAQVKEFQAAPLK